MRTYETIFIIHPEVAGDAYTEVVEKFKGILIELGANMLAVEEWGTRKLAYIVQKQERGTYVLFAYEGKPEGIRELERRFRIDDKVIKFMTIQLEGEYKPSGFVRKTDDSESKVSTEESPKAEESPKSEAASSEKPAEAPAAEETAAKEAPTEEASAKTETEKESA